MKKYVPLNKRSKKEQREYYSRRRRTWGEMNPVTRSVPDGKKYNRKKEKQRTGREIRNGFDAGLLYLSNVVSLSLRKLTGFQRVFFCMKRLTARQNRIIILSS